MEGLKQKLEFPSYLIQAEAIRSLVAIILKEKGSNETIGDTTHAQSLWQQCSSDSPLIRWSCCQALVLLVDQGHAHLEHTLHQVLNNIPTARNVQGLVAVVSKLLQLKLNQQDKQAPCSQIYAIRTSPHPFISLLESRVDCWPYLLQEIQKILQDSHARSDTQCVSMLLPFLRYLYCDPHKRPDQAPLRQGLIRLLLPVPGCPFASPTSGGLLPKSGDSMPASASGTSMPDPSPGGLSSMENSLFTEVVKSVVRCMLDLLPHIQVDDMASLLELTDLLGLLVTTMLNHQYYHHEDLHLLVGQLLYACHLALELGSDIAHVVSFINTLLPYCTQAVLFDQVFMGVCVLLLHASATQQTMLLKLVVVVIQLCVSPPAGGFWLLLLPLLQITSTCDLMKALMCTQVLHANQELVRNLLQTLKERDTSPACTKGQEGATEQTYVTMYDFERTLLNKSNTWLVELSLASHTLRGMATNPVATADWLHAIASSLPRIVGQATPPDTLPLLLTHVLICHSGYVGRLGMDTVAILANTYPSQVSTFLPVLIYKLSSSHSLHDASLSLCLLHTIPKMATHKACVAQVLQVLRWLWSVPKLRGLVLCLMTSLWHKQERVYPELQRLLSSLEKGAALLSKDAQWEQVLARATCIRDICRERPYKHGADMLAAITLNLSRYTHMDHATPCALMLDGLQELIKAEVVDISSTWKALSSQLCEDNRPLVMQAIARLLSHTQTLAVPTQEYQKVREQVMGLLWTYALHQTPEIARCGFKALSAFPAEFHLNLHLPEQVRPEGKEEDDEDEEAKSNQDVCVSGPSFMKLLFHTPTAVLPGLQLLLHSLISEECVCMPRGVYHAALRAGVGASRSKTLAGIPAFLMKAYEKNTQPGLKSGLAVSLLCCYDTPIQKDKEGRPIARFLVSRGRGYQQTLSTLIHEVSLQPNEWHFSILLFQAWRSFMGRAFIANLEGRKAELEMLRKKETHNAKELHDKETWAWLWVRDQLTDVIKSVAKESPVVQGNCILALASLASAVSKYHTNMETFAHSSGVGPEFLPTTDWLCMVIDTLLGIIGSSHRPRGQGFSWLSHRSNTASVLARSCAMLGLALVIPNVQRELKDGGVLAVVVAELSAALPGKASAEESQALALHGGLTLGLLLAGIEEDRSGLRESSLEELLTACFNQALDSNSGCVLGAGILLSSLFAHTERIGVERLLDSFTRMLVLLQDTQIQRSQQEVLAYAVACICVSGFSRGQVCADRAEEAMNTLRRLAEDNQQSPGVAMALGMAVHGLAASGHGKADNLKPRLLDAWTRIFLAEACSTLVRLASLHGLVALMGSEHTLLQLKCELSSLEQSHLNDVIRSITQVISCSSAIGLQSKGVCLLAHLHLAHLTSGHAHTTVPQDYTYLPERSLIRASVDILIEAGKKGPEFATPEMVKTCLSPLAAAGSDHQFPPINWNTLLSPLMRLHFGEEVQHHCLELAASQTSTSHNASLFLAQWLAPPLVHSLSVRTRAHLYERLCVWMRHVPDDRLQGFLNLAIDLDFRSPLRGPSTLSYALLKGLAIAMTFPDPPQNVWTCLRNTSETIYSLLPNHIQDGDVELYVGVAKCLSELSDMEIDRITKVTETSREKAAFILAYLASLGRLPLLCLNDVISASLHSTANQDTVACLLLRAFYKSRFATGTHAGIPMRMEWLLELMGHIRNVAYGSTTVPCGNVPQATDYLFGVLSAALISWADLSTPLLLGIHTHWCPSLQDKWTDKKKMVDSAAMRTWLGGQDQTLRLCQEALPIALPRLLEEEPWKSQTQKFLDWLCSIAEAPSTGVSQHTVCKARAALLALKVSPEFKKKSVWTRAYGW